MQNKKFVLLIHGKGGSPDSSWFPWLKEKLISQGYTCIAPKFPENEDSKLHDWFTVFDTQKLNLKETTIVAHARGAMALLRWVESLPTNTRIKKIITVACNFDYQPNRSDGEAFYSTKLDYEDIKLKCPNITVIHSADDPYVPLKAGEGLAENLDARFIKLHSSGHFGNDKHEAPEILNEVI